MALKKGVIDSTQWDVSGITGLNLHEVAKYRIMGGGNDAIPGHILINLERWKAYPDDIKNALRGAAEDYFNILNETYMSEMDKVNALVKEGKVVNCHLDADCIKKHEEVAQELWDEIGKRDPAAAKAVELVKKWRAGLK
jgi:TRAP-type C4-dicarboxylate transport system substrate-binding protein